MVLLTNYLHIQNHCRETLLVHIGAVNEAGKSLGVRTVAGPVGPAGQAGKALEVLELHVATKDKACLVPATEHKPCPVPTAHHNAVDQQERSTHVWEEGEGRSLLHCEPWHLETKLTSRFFTHSYLLYKIIFLLMCETL